MRSFLDFPAKQETHPKGTGRKGGNVSSFGHDSRQVKEGECSSRPQIDCPAGLPIASVEFLRSRLEPRADPPDFDPKI